MLSVPGLPYPFSPLFWFWFPRNGLWGLQYRQSAWEVILGSTYKGMGNWERKGEEATAGCAKKQSTAVGKGWFCVWAFGQLWGTHLKAILPPEALELGCSTTNIHGSLAVGCSQGNFFLKSFSPHICLRARPAHTAREKPWGGESQLLQSEETVSMRRKGECLGGLGGHQQPLRLNPPGKPLSPGLILRAAFCLPTVLSCC